jgi:hypothetical protein
MIEELISIVENEDKKNPLTDEQISKVELSSQNI